MKPHSPLCRSKPSPTSSIAFKARRTCRFTYIRQFPPKMKAFQTEVHGENQKDLRLVQDKGEAVFHPSPPVPLREHDDCRQHAQIDSVCQLFHSRRLLTLNCCAQLQDDGLAEGRYPSVSVSYQIRVTALLAFNVAVQWEGYSPLCLFRFPRWHFMEALSRCALTPFRSDKRRDTSEQRAINDDRRATSDERQTMSEARRATSDERRTTSDQRRANSHERGATNDARRARFNGIKTILEDIQQY